MSPQKQALSESSGTIRISGGARRGSEEETELETRLTNHKALRDNFCDGEKCISAMTQKVIGKILRPNTHYTSGPNSHVVLMTITVGVLALQGAFLEHLILLKRARDHLRQGNSAGSYEFTEVRNVKDLARCDALIIPGGESTTIALVAAQSSLLEPLREFVKVHRKPTWGTCAGLILLAEAANATKKGGQDLIGGLDVRVNRNHFGRQVESFQADLDLPFLNTSDDASRDPFPGVFIRAPVVEKILPNFEGVQKDEQQSARTIVAPSRSAKDDQARLAMSSHVEVMAKLPGRLKKAAAMGAEVNAGEEAGDIIAVKQGNVFGTSFHPELTSDIRIHVWWLREVLDALGTANGIH